MKKKKENCAICSDDLRSSSIFSLCSKHADITLGINFSRYFKFNKKLSKINKQNTFSLEGRDVELSCPHCKKEFTHKEPINLNVNFEAK